MRTETITRTIYKFNELSETAQQKALEKLYDPNVLDSFWYEHTIEEAKELGLDIKSWDTERYAKGHFTKDATEVAHKITEEHGRDCETFKTALAYLNERDAVEKKCNVSEELQEEQLVELDELFLRDILEDYRLMLRKEYEYQTSGEAIKETIEANDYEFDEDGSLV